MINASHAVLFFGAWLIVCALAASAHAVAPAVLVGPDLRGERVRITSLRDGTLNYFDAQRRLQSASIDELVQVRAIDVTDEDTRATPSATLPQPGGALLTLVDGQRLAGNWVGPADGGDAIEWNHPLLGKLNVALERVRGWQTESDGAIGAQPAEDQLVLANGDALSGFVVAMTEQGVSIQTANADAPIDLPRDRVASVVLANPPQAPATGRHTLVLADGSVLHVTDLRIVGERVLCRIPLYGGQNGGEAQEKAQVTIPLGRLRRIDFTASGRRLMPLIDCERESSGGEVFGLSRLPWVEGDALRLHAPVTVTFHLPAGAKRLAATAELATGPDAPAQLTAWADLEINLYAEDTRLRWYHLHGKNPTAQLNVAAPSTGALRLELDPGVNGPVLDRVRLRDGVVLVEPAGGNDDSAD